MSLPQAPDQGDRRLFYTIRQALVSMGGRRSRGKVDGHGKPRERIRHSCLFHDDPTPSADFYADDGWYYCHGCGKVYNVDEVVAELRERGAGDLALQVVGEVKENARRGRGGRGAETMSAHHHSKYGEPDAVYTYRHPKSRQVSHYKLRWTARDEHGDPTIDEATGKATKHIRYQGASYNWTNVVPIWPVYGDTTLWPGLSIVVCESEKAVNAINSLAELYNDTLIVAVTCGGSENLLQSGRLLADRLVELAPARVLLWPDNDRRRQTMRWVAPLQRSLEAAGVTVGRVDLATLGLPLKAGPDDYAAQGGRLADVFGTVFIPAGAPTLDQLGRELTVTADGRVLVPGTRRLVDPRPENLEAIWFRHTGGQVPKQAALKLLRSSLLSRGFESRTQVAYRRWHDAATTCAYWRPYEHGRCYRVNQDGVTLADDPPDTLLMVEGDPRFDPAIDEDGDMDDLETLVSFFGLTTRHAALLLGWLVCAFIGRQAPILVLRGEAGAGKTTLATLLLAILEPGCPSLSLPADQRANFDSRQFVETLRRTSAVLIDNVSRFSSEAEDLLSQVVTGYGVSQRRLNTHDVEMLNMRRAVIITTISWDVRKGDLANRLMPLHLEDRSEYIPEMEIRRRFEPLVRRIRGLVFAAAQEFYQMQATTPPRTHIRVADLGFVLSALGYDSPDLAALLHRVRSDVLAETDYWTGAVRSMYRDHYPDQYPNIGDYFLATSQDIASYMVGYGCDDIPSPRSPAFARWLRERNPVFKDAGFMVVYTRDSGFRGWKIQTIRRDEWEDEQ